MDTIIFGTPQPPTSTVTPYRSLVRAVEPVVEPVSLAEAKVQCRVDVEDSDAYISSLIAVARQYVEEMCDITLLTSVWEARYDLFPIWSINLPRPPMAPGNVTVTYRRGDGTNGTLSSDNGDFRVDTNVIPGRIYPNWAQSWPATRGDENSVTVRYSAGYGPDGRTAPPVAKHLILLLVSHWYDSRQLAVTGGQVQVPYTFRTLLHASGLGIYR
jgi:uncharacterized phiE125 gp8 family phage protein